MPIRLMRDAQYAPCAYLVVRPNARGEYDTRDESNTALVSSDWEFPALAQNFGWNWNAEGCDHDGTDGTVKCPSCGKRAGAFIHDAITWMDEHLGAETSDAHCGYFEGRER